MQFEVKLASTEAAETFISVAGGYLPKNMGNIKLHFSLFLPEADVFSFDQLVHQHRSGPVMNQALNSSSHHVIIYS